MLRRRRHLLLRRGHGAVGEAGRRLHRPTVLLIGRRNLREHLLLLLLLVEQGEALLDARIRRNLAARAGGRELEGLVDVEGGY